MSLQDLPPELISRIVSYLPSNKGFTTHSAPEGRKPENDFATYSTICRAWLPAVEERSFKALFLSSGDLDEYERLLTTAPVRGALLRDLHFSVILPPYSDISRGRFERQADQELNNEAFSRQIVRLFKLLSQFDHHESAKPLRLILYSSYSLTDTQPISPTSTTRDLRIHRFQHSYIRLVNAEQLVPLQRLTEFICNESYHRKLAPSTLADIANKLPNVESMEWSLSDAERTFPALRKQVRSELADALKRTSCPKLREFGLSFAHENTGDDSYITADVRGGSNGHDSFSQSMRKILCNWHVPSVVLHGPICIDSGLFWSSDSGATWPHMERLGVEFSIVRPDGEYYFDRDPHNFDNLSDSSSDMVDDFDEDIHGEAPAFEDYTSFLQYADSRQTESDPYDDELEKRRTGSYNPHTFRTYPNESIEPLLEAAARGAASMPQLKTMYAGAEIDPCRRTDHDRPRFDFTYAAAGISLALDETEDDRCCPRLYWTVPRGWKMSTSLEKLWRILLGPNGVVKYTEW